MLLVFELLQLGDDHDLVDALRGERVYLGLHNGGQRLEIGVVAVGGIERARTDDAHAAGRGDVLNTGVVTPTTPISSPFSSRIADWPRRRPPPRLGRWFRWACRRSLP